MNKQALLIRRFNYDIIGKNFDDINLPSKYEYQDDDTLVKQIVDFFKNGSDLIYPAKSFFVGIVYAKCMEVTYNEDFYKMLDDPTLLFDDKYFIRYKDAQDIYDQVIEQIDLDHILELPSTQKTVEYFQKEFTIGGMI